VVRVTLIEPAEQNGLIAADGRHGMEYIGVRTPDWIHGGPGVLAQIVYPGLRRQWRPILLIVKPFLGASSEEQDLVVAEIRHRVSPTSRGMNGRRLLSPGSGLGGRGVGGRRECERGRKDQHDQKTRTDGFLRHRHRSHLPPQLDLRGREHSRPIECDRVASIALPAGIRLRPAWSPRATRAQPRRPTHRSTTSSRPSPIKLPKTRNVYRVKRSGRTVSKA
jgi:hypothetical protein